MAKSTRFTTTVTTRNLVTPQGFDGFYLDGRVSGPRDARGGDSTLDREDRGFFYALFTNSGADVNQTAIRNKKYLDKIFEDMKLANRFNIDYEINELADCAVNISGRLTLSDSQQLPPYFAGIVVKDGEMAAITSGRGCAYLYRNDLLYPLTKDEFPLSDVDLHGNKIPNLELYCAGLAGTIRYSNIAQLQPDDCFVLCNKEVMETIGHHGMLKILEDAYDQQDAAARVNEEMMRRNPGVTAQFMIGFVENITTLDKAGLKSLTGRLGWTQKTLGNPGGLNALEQGTSSGDSAALAGAAVSGAAAAGVAASASEAGYTALSSESTNADANLYAQQQVADYNDFAPRSNDRILQGVDEGLSTGKKIAAGVMVLVILLLATLFAWLLLDGELPTFLGGSKSTETPVVTNQVGVPTAIVATTAVKPSELFPDLTTKRPNGSETATQSGSSSLTNATTKVQNQNTNVTTAPSKTSPTIANNNTNSSKPAADAATGGQKYKVKEGDTVWGIAVANANGTDIDEYIKKIIEANKDKATADKSNLEIYPNDEIILPKP